MGLPLAMQSILHLPMFTTVNGYGYCRYEVKGTWALAKSTPALIGWSLSKSRGWYNHKNEYWQTEGLASYQDVVHAAAQVDSQKPEQLPQSIADIASADAHYWYYVTVMVGAAKVSKGSLQAFLDYLTSSQCTSGDFLTGIESPTLAAQHALNEVAYSTLPLAAFVKTYGHQIYDLDFIHPTLGEDLNRLESSIERIQQNAIGETSYTLCASALATHRAQQTESLRMRLGPIRKRLFDRLLRWARQEAPGREQAIQ